MMKLVVAGVAALLMLTGAASAKGTPPSAAQKAEFYKVCMSIAQNATLCTCKADAAMKLIDTDFMSVVIASMKGQNLPQQYFDAYDEYIYQSNRVCAPQY
jgi:hypothetical protein